MYDLLLKGGTVIDPAQGMYQPMDVALRDGLITAVEPDIPSTARKQVVDVSGKLVVPGLVDLHAHVFPGVSQLGLDADEYCLAKGTTTLSDAGSAGALNIEGFRRFVVESARARIRALLNISVIGMPSKNPNFLELGWLALADVDAAMEAIEAHRDLIWGLKVRLSAIIVGENGIKPLLLTLEASERAGLPIMVHIGGSPGPLTEILDLLRPGDIVTHTFTAYDGDKRRFTPKGSGKTILDSKGNVISAVWAARERGVVMDVGHGAASYSFAVCAAAIKQGFKPDTISSDLHTGNVNGPVYDLPTVMSRFLSLGMTLQEIIEASTIRPAQVLGMEDEIGTLRPGSAGDVAVLDLAEGRFEFKDAPGESLWGARKLTPVLTVLGGKVV